MISAHASQENLTVHELQQAARDVTDTLDHKAESVTGVSRLALLSLIEKLSWQARFGLTFMAAILICLGGLGFAVLTSAPSGFIGRLLLWGTLVSSTGYSCARHVWRYRRGVAFATKPFSWRAIYTARLSVFSTAIGAGALILTPIGLSSSPSVIVLVAVAASGLIGAALHSAHRAAAYAVALPALLGSLIAAAMRFNIGTGENLSGLLAATAVAVIGVLLISWQTKRVAASAAKSWPRQVSAVLTDAEKAKRRAYNPYRMKKATQENAVAIATAAARA